MTGIYLRVQRDGHWDNIEIDQLTDAELDEWAKESWGLGDPQRGYIWAVALAKWIRDHVKEGGYE